MLQKKFYIGQKVWLKHEQQLATVSDNSDNDIIYVIADGMEIPVFAEDVDVDVPASDGIHKERNEESSKSEEVISGNDRTEIKIVFEPIKNSEETTGFKVYLINSTFELNKIKYSLYERDYLFFTHAFEAEPQKINFLHTLEFDQLNESPEIEVQIWVGEKYFKRNIRIKPKNFFNKLAFVQELNSDGYLFLLELANEQEPEITDDKFELDTDKLKHLMQNKAMKNKNVLQQSHAERVIDLHIEKIMKDFKALSNNDIVDIQLSYFQRALSAAMRSHLDHMFVIHGLGKGVLKNRIFDILRTYPGIKEFKNDYHPLFGWGATEIIFK